MEGKLFEITAEFLKESRTIGDFYSIIDKFTTYLVIPEIFDDFIRDHYSKRQTERIQREWESFLELHPDYLFYRYNIDVSELDIQDSRYKKYIDDAEYDVHTFRVLKNIDRIREPQLVNVQITSIAGKVNSSGLVTELW